MNPAAINADDAHDPAACVWCGSVTSLRGRNIVGRGWALGSERIHERCVRERTRMGGK